MRECRTGVMKEYSFGLRVAVVLSVLQLVHASWWYLGVASSYQPIVDELNHSPDNNEDNHHIHNNNNRNNNNNNLLGGSSSSSRRRGGGGDRGGGNNQKRELMSCDDLHYLDPRQREMCALDKSLIHVLTEGASRSIEECKYQFRDRRWNCSTFNTTTVFGNILNIKSRETAYIYAISSAGVMYAVTRACSKGELIKCGCDRKVRRRHSTDGTFEWGGCSDNIRYGARFSRDFVDANELRFNADGLMNLWNNGAGRKVTKDSMDIVCKCHGVSGSCSVKVCWRKLRSFRLIGKGLKDKFDGASFVRFDKKRTRLKRVTKQQKRPRKSDLVYLTESPDFCEFNQVTGSLGTKGRQCNKTSYGLDGCTLMCCGRGYYTLIQEEKYDCDCKFHWCCRVECKQCTQVREMTYCN